MTGFQGPNERGFPLRITRRDFVVSTGALIAAAALFGSAPLAFAETTLEELMRPGPLPDMVLGKADAPITIVEYASMTCPHCANFDKTTFPGLKAKVHRHRESAFHLPRISARRARGRGLDAGAAARRRQAQAIRSMATRP